MRAVECQGAEADPDRPGGVQESRLHFRTRPRTLDANNEREIMEQLHAFYKGRTVVVVAHRLSTVRDADKIVVLDKGRIVEEGTHQNSRLAGTYYVGEEPVGAWELWN